MEHNPELKKEIYVVEDDIEFLDYDKLNNILGNSSKFKEIYKYKEIDLPSINTKCLIYFIAHGHINVQKYFVDNIIDLNYLLQSNNYQEYLINLIISCKNYKLAKYVVKKININCITPSSGGTPLVYLVNKDAEKSKLILYIIDNKADIKIKNN